MTEAEQDTIRHAVPGDAVHCAAIKNDWIDSTDWMPRVHPAKDVARHYQEFVFRKREVFVAGQPAGAFIVLDDDDFITSLFSAHPGQGKGKALVDHAKQLRPRLSLWTFVANVAAQRFYLREGFREVDRSEGDNEEGLPDLLYHWEAA